jgi:cold shock protein
LLRLWPGKHSAGCGFVLLQPYFSGFFCSQSDFGYVPRYASLMPSFRIPQKPGCGAAQRAVVISDCKTRRPTMQKGTVKWFNPTKGYGFIKPTSGDKDVFVHISAVERAGLSTLNEGQTVEYELVTNRGKSSAENLKVA